MLGDCYGLPSANGCRRLVLRVGSLFAVVVAVALSAASPASGQLLSSEPWGSVEPVAPTSTSLVPVVEPALPGLTPTEAAAAVLIPCVQSGASLYRECQRALSVLDDVCGADTVACVADKLNVTCSVPTNPRSSAVAAPEYGPCVAAALALANQTLATVSDALRRPVVDPPDVDPPIISVGSPCSLLPSAATTSAAADPDVCVEEASRLARAVLELTAGMMYMACEGAQAAQCATNKAAIVCGSLGATGTLSAQRDPDECVRQVMRITRDAQEVASGIAYTVCRDGAGANCAVGYVASACNVDLATRAAATAANDPGACVQRAQQIVTLTTDVLYGAIDTAYGIVDIAGGAANGVVDSVCGGDQAAQCVQRELGEACATAPTLATATSRNADRCVTLATGTALGLVDLANGVVYAVCGPDVAGCPLEKLTQVCESAPALRAGDPTVHPCVARALTVADMAGELAGEAVATANRTAATATQLVNDTQATVNQQLDAACRNVPTAATRDAAADPVQHPCMQLALATTTGVLNLVNGTIDAACGTRDRVQCAGDKLIQACRTVPAAKSDPAIPVHPCIDLVLSIAGDATATVNREIDRACPGADAAGCANAELTRVCALSPVALSSRAALDDPSYHPCIRTVLKIADATTLMVDGIVDSVCAGRDEVACVDHQLTVACTSAVDPTSRAAAADDVPRHPCVGRALNTAENVVRLVQQAVGTAAQPYCGTQAPDNCALNKVRDACATPIHLTARAAAEPEPCVQLVVDTAFWAQKTADDAVRTACGGTTDPTVCANQKLAQACSPIHLTSRADAQTDPCVALVVGTARGVMDTVTAYITAACGTPDPGKCVLDTVERACGPVTIGRSAADPVPVFHPCIELALKAANDTLKLIQSVCPAGDASCAPPVACPVGGGTVGVACFEKIVWSNMCKFESPLAALCWQLVGTVLGVTPACGTACGAAVLFPPIHEPAIVPEQWVSDRPTTRTVTAAAASPAGLDRFELEINGQVRATADAGGALATTAQIRYSMSYLREATNTLSLVAVDNAKQRSLAQTWTLKVDTSAPFIRVEGDLYQPEGHAHEEISQLSYAVTDPLSGVRNVEIHVRPVNGTERCVLRDPSLDPPAATVSEAQAATDDRAAAEPEVPDAGQRCSRTVDTLGTSRAAANEPDAVTTDCPAECPRTRNGSWTFRATDFPEGDGEYRIRVVSTDRLGNRDHVAWRVNVDARGNIYKAEVLDGPPSTNAALLSEEHAQLGTRNARADLGDAYATQTLVSCVNDAAGCLESRLVDTEQSHTEVTTGTSAEDDRVWMSLLLERQAEDIGTLAATGSIRDATASGQTLPPAHGDQYLRYDKTESIELDGVATEMTERTWLDSATRLPLRRELVLEGRVDSQQVMHYSPVRLETEELADPYPFEPTPQPTNSSRATTLSMVNLPAAPAPTATSVDMVAKSLAFRKLFGLNTDAALIESLVDNSKTNRSGTYQFGVPLTPSELTEMNLRVAMAEKRTIVDSFGANSTTFAGSYLDNARGGLLYVGFTSNADAQVSQLRASYPYPDRLRSFTAQFTLTSLESVANRIRADLRASGTAGGVAATMVGIDEELNRVVVGVAPPVPGTPSVPGVALPTTTAAEEQLRAHYGPSVTAEEADPKYMRNKGVLGGVAIDSQPGGDQYGNDCTLAFEGIREGTAGTRASFKYFQTTAGHCVQGKDDRDGTAAAGRGYPVKDAWGKLGVVTRASFPKLGGSGVTDSAAIRLVPAKFRTNVMFIWKRLDQPTSTTRSVGPRMTNLGKGNPACGTGMTSGQFCGVMGKRTSSTGDYDISLVFELKLGDECVRSGDSGGPVYATRSTNIGPAGIISSTPKYDGACSLPIGGGRFIPGGHLLHFVPIGTAMNQVGLELNRERRP